MKEKKEMPKDIGNLEPSTNIQRRKSWRSVAAHLIGVGKSLDKLDNMTGGDQDRWTKMGGHGARQILVYINLDQILRYMGRNKRLKKRTPSSVCRNGSQKRRGCWTTTHNSDGTARADLRRWVWWDPSCSLKGEILHGGGQVEIENEPVG